MLKYLLGSVLNTDSKIYRECFKLMTPDRQKRILRLKNDNQQKLSLLGEWLAKSLIAEAVGTDLKNLIFEIDSKGKPYIDSTPEIYFNISHSCDMAIAAISDKPVGIDIEKIRPVSLKLARRACTESELIYVFGHNPDANDYETPFPHPVYERFFEIWTAKEAYFKCIGTGITDLKSVDTLNSNFKKEMIKKDDYIIHIVIL